MSQDIFWLAQLKSHIYPQTNHHSQKDWLSLYYKSTLEAEVGSANKREDSQKEGGGRTDDDNEELSSYVTLPSNLIQHAMAWPTEPIWEEWLTEHSNLTTLLFYIKLPESSPCLDMDKVHAL